MAGATTLGDLASAIGTRTEESAIIAELKAGSEEAYSWLIGEFHQPIYSLIFRMVKDPSDAADTTQDVFLKVFRGMKHFHGESPFDKFAHTEVRDAVDQALQQVPEPYRTALILRDLEEMSYEEIAEVLAISLGTVKSRITRGRDALRKILAGYAREVGPELGLLAAADVAAQSSPQGSRAGSKVDVEVEVTP